MLIDPGPARWQFPVPASGHGDLIAVGGDLSPATLLEAYRSGLFPMPVEDEVLRDGFAAGRRGREAEADPDCAPEAETSIGWWSPTRRGVLFLDRLRVPRSLRQACARYEIRFDTAFSEVVAGCADPARPGGWISKEVAHAYRALHALGWAHSVEAWRGEELVGGLYGVAIGGLFAGESMFSRARDASKVALVGLVEVLDDAYGPQRLIDAQWRTPHLASLGVEEIPRQEYLARLPRLLEVPQPAVFGIADPES